MNVSEIKSRYQDGQQIFRTQTIGILLDEIERLRAALVKISDIEPEMVGGTEWPKVEYSYYFAAAQNTARAAIAAATGEGETNDY